MLKKMGFQEDKKLLAAAAMIFAAAMHCGMNVKAAEISQMTSQDALILHQSVSDNSAWGMFGSGGIDNVQPGDGTDIQNPDTNGENAGEIKVPEEAGSLAEAETKTEITEAGEAAAKETVPVQVVDSTQLQTLNYKDGILTDWQQIMDGLRTLSPDALSNADSESKSLVLQLQNVTNIPAGIGNCLASDDSGYTKYLHCNVGYGASLVFSGTTDNSGFRGVSNAAVTVDSEKRGKKSMAVTVRFASHEDMGTVASLHVNLPQCSKGTKVSVYAETVSVDEDGNVQVGENTCIGNTKADENGNVEVLIQSTANYMFVYKAAKE